MSKLPKTWRNIPWFWTPLLSAVMKENLCSYAEGLDFFQFDFKLEDFLTFALRLRHKARATAGNWSVPHKSMCLSPWFLSGGITLEGRRVFGFLRPGWWTQVTSRAGVGCLEGCSSVLFLSFSVWYSGRIHLKLITAIMDRNTPAARPSRLRCLLPSKLGTTKLLLPGFWSWRWEKLLRPRNYRRVINS